MRFCVTANEIIQAAKTAAPRAPMVQAGMDVAPIIDAHGRMHAPCDGYQWNGATYRAGEFIGESSYAPRPRKIKAKADAADAIAAALGGECGREFHGCKIAYVPLTDAQWAAVAAVLPTPKAMMLASEADARGLPHGKSFKFSWRRWINARMRDFDDSDCEGISEALDGKIVCYVYGEIVA